jgi:DNA repair exonuclease SbcCD ATPase subunit
MTNLARLRTALLPALALLTGPLPACKDEEKAGTGGAPIEEMSIVVEADKTRILEEEQTLKKERANVEEEQARIERERAEITERLASLSKKDKSQRDKLEADQRRVQGEEARLNARMRSFQEDRDKLERDKNVLLEKISRLEQPKGTQTIQQREETMAKRERDLAKREAELAQREKAVAEREAEVVKTLRDAQSLLANAGSTRTVVVAASQTNAAANPTAASVGALRREVMRKMEYRGLLPDDLPPTAREFDQDARASLKSKDYSVAQDALLKLDKAVDAVVVNGAFVQGKMTRINRTYSNTKLDQSRSTQDQKLLSEFGELATDGRWDRANQKANQMVAIYQSK